MGRVGASALLRAEDLPNFPPEWEPLLRQINQSQGGLQTAVNGGLTLDDNLSLERVTVNLSHGVAQLVRLKKLASAAGAIVIGVAGTGANNYALAIPLILTSTSTPSQVKLTAYFTDSTATRVQVCVLLFKEGVASSVAPSVGTVRASYNTANAQALAAATITTINFGVQKYDSDSAVTNPTTAFLFTVPAGKGGVYHFNACVGFNTGGTGGEVTAQLEVNTLAILQIGRAINNTSGGITQLTGGGDILLNAGDAVRVRGYSSAVATLINQGAYNYFTVHRVFGS